MPNLVSDKRGSWSYFDQNGALANLSAVVPSSVLLPGVNQLQQFNRIVYRAHVLAPGHKTRLGRSSGSGGDPFIPYDGVPFGSIQWFSASYLPPKRSVLDVRRDRERPRDDWSTYASTFDISLFPGLDQRSQFERQSYVAHVLAPGLKTLLGKSEGTGPGDPVVPVPFDPVLWPAIEFLRSYRAAGRAQLDVRPATWFQSSPLTFQSVTDSIQQFAWGVHSDWPRWWAKVPFESRWQSYRDDPWFFKSLYDPLLFPSIEWASQFTRSIYVANVLAPGIRTLLGRSSGSGADVPTPTETILSSSFDYFSPAMARGLIVDPRSVQAPQEPAWLTVSTIFDPALFVSIDQIRQFGRISRVAHVLAPGRRYFPRHMDAGPGILDLSVVPFDPIFLAGLSQLGAVMTRTRPRWHPGLTYRPAGFSTPYDFAFVAAMNFFTRSERVRARDRRHPRYLHSAEDLGWVFENLPAALAIDPALIVAVLAFYQTQWKRLKFNPQWIQKPSQFATPYDLSFLSAINWLSDSYRMLVPKHLHPGWLVPQQFSIKFDAPFPSQYQSVQHFVNSFLVKRRPRLDLRWLSGLQPLWITDPIINVPAWSAAEWFTRSLRMLDRPLWRPGLLEQPQDVDPFYAMGFDPALYAGIKYLIDSFRAMGPGRLDPRWLEQPSQAWIFRALPFDPSVYQGIKQFVDSFRAPGHRVLQPTWLEQPQIAWIFKNLPPPIIRHLFRALLGIGR